MNNVAIVFLKKVQCKKTVDQQHAQYFKLVASEKIKKKKKK